MTVLPDLAGHFGRYGGRFVPEALIRALDELDDAYRSAKTDPVFQAELTDLLRNYAGTPSLLYPAKRLSARLGAEILLKREDLNHTGAHKVRNVLGQALLAKRMGKPRVIAEAWPARPRPPCSTSSAWSTWARPTPSGRRSTSRGCGCSAPP
jgi:tryptophan synthase beta chain